MSFVKKKAEWKKMLTVEKQLTEVKEEVGSYFWRKTRIKKVEKWAVMLSGSKEVLGLYDDHKYASSRARYFYKKYMRESETILLG